MCGKKWVKICVLKNFCVKKICVKNMVSIFKNMKIFKYIAQIFDKNKKK